MTISDIGSIGEFIGSIAILVTLVYLTIQTRHSVKASKQKSHSDILSRRQDLLRLLTEDREFIELWGKGLGRLPLDSVDAQRFTTFALSYSTHLQDAYIQYKEGLISKDVWKAELAIFTPLPSQPGFLDWWEHGQQFLTLAFIEVVESSKATNLVLYDPETQKWSRPQDGKFGMP